MPVTTAATNYTDRDTTSGAAYLHHVTAIDRLNNEPEPGNAVEITVGGSGGGGCGNPGGNGGGTEEVCDDGADSDDRLVDHDDSDCRRNKACR